MSANVFRGNQAFGIVNPFGDPFSSGISGGRGLGKESRDMTFDGVTEGINLKGVEDYLDYLRVEVIQKICEELSNTKDIATKINAGWQGQSRDAFLKKFDNTIMKTQEELVQEFKNLIGKINTLVSDYYEQDAKMMDI